MEVVFFFSYIQIGLLKEKMSLWLYWALCSPYCESPHIGSSEGKKYGSHKGMAQIGSQGWPLRGIPTPWVFVTWNGSENIKVKTSEMCCLATMSRPIGGSPQTYTISRSKEFLSLRLCKWVAAASGKRTVVTESKQLKFINSPINLSCCWQLGFCITVCLQATVIQLLCFSITGTRQPYAPAVARSKSKLFW